jgi:hypothetical protein
MTEKHDDHLIQTIMRLNYGLSEVLNEFSASLPKYPKPNLFGLFCQAFFRIPFNWLKKDIQAFEKVMLGELSYFIEEAKKDAL